MKIMLPIARSDIHLWQRPQRAHVRELTMLGNFACAETVDVVGPKGIIKGAVVVAPARKYTQVEVSFTNSESFVLRGPHTSRFEWP